MPGPIEAIRILSQTEPRWTLPDPSEGIRKGRWVLQSVSHLERHALDLKRPLCGSQETIPPIFLLLNPSDTPDPDIIRPVYLTCVRLENNPPGFRGQVYQAKIEFLGGKGYDEYQVGYFLLPSQRDPQFHYRQTPYWTADPEKWENAGQRFIVTADSLGTNVVHGILFDLRQLRKNATTSPEDLKMVAYPVFPDSGYSKMFNPQTGRLIIRPDGKDQTAGVALDASVDISPEDLSFLQEVIFSEKPFIVRYITNQNQYARKNIPIPVIISGDPDATITTFPSRDPEYEILRVISPTFNRVFKGYLNFLNDGSVILSDSFTTKADFNQFPDQPSTKALIIVFSLRGLKAKAVTLPIPSDKMTGDRLEQYLAGIKRKTDHPPAAELPPRPTHLPASGTVYEAPHPKISALEKLLGHLKDFPPGVLTEGLQEYHAEILLPADQGDNVRFPVSVKVNRDHSQVILEIINLPLKGVATERTSLRAVLRAVTQTRNDFLHSLTIRIVNQKNAAPVMEATARRLTTGQETRLGAVSDDQTRLNDLLSWIEPPQYANKLTPPPKRQNPRVAK